MISSLAARGTDRSAPEASVTSLCPYGAELHDPVHGDFRRFHEIPGVCRLAFQLDQIPGNLPDKARRPQKLWFSPNHAHLRRGHGQLLSGSGNAYITETAFLLQLFRILPADRHVAGESIFLHSRHIDIIKLQPLRAVERHQKNVIAVRIHGVNIRNQRNLLQEFRERRVLRLLHIVRRLGDQLVDILNPRLVLVGSLLLQLRHVSGLADDHFQNLTDIQVLPPGCAESANQRGKLPYTVQRSPQPRNPVRILQGFIKTDAIFQSVILNPGQRCGSHPSFGNIDNALHSQVIQAVIHGFQVSQHILYFPAGIEIHTAHQLIRNIGSYHLLLEQAGLGIGSVQNRIIPVRPVLLPHLFGNFPRNKFRLVVTGLKFPEADPGSLSVICPEFLFLSAAVVGNHLVGRVQNTLGGTVILLQFNHFRAWKRLLKVQNIHDVRAAEFIDRLIIVSHHADIPVFFRQELYKTKLHGIGILILINQDIAESFLIAFQHIRSLLEKLHGKHQKIIKIQGVIFLQPLLISPIRPRSLFFLPAGCVRLHLIRGNQVVFGGGYLPQQRLLLINLRIQLQLFDDRLHHLPAVVGVIDGETVIIADPVDIPAENPAAAGVKGGNPDCLRSHSDQAVHPFPHLSGSLIRKSNGHDIPWPHPAVFN